MQVRRFSGSSDAEDDSANERGEAKFVILPCISGRPSDHGIMWIQNKFDFQKKT